jgi:hypothetical protein
MNAPFRVPLTAPQVTWRSMQLGKGLIKDGRHVGLDVNDLLIEAFKQSVQRWFFSALTEVFKVRNYRALCRLLMCPSQDLI